MITAPYPIAPQLGPLAAPSEEEVAAAYPELRDHALTLAWTAEVLGRQAAQLLGLARAGELLLVPGPWAMRQADDPGYFVPAWQLPRGGRGPHPSMPPLLAAGWTSLELHRFMTTPLDADGTTPAALLRAGDTARVSSLIRDEPAAGPVPQPAKPRRHAHRRIALHAHHRAGGRRSDRRGASAIGGRR